MVRRAVNYCLIDYDPAISRLRVRGLTPHGPLMEFGSKELDQRRLVEKCNAYWKFVDAAVLSGELTNGVDRLQAFYDKLMTQGHALVNVLMDLATRQRLWSIARQSDVLILVTDLLQVPWEALFNSEPGTRTFLAHECIITRWPERSAERGEREIQKRRKFTKKRIILLDSVLAAMVLTDLCVEAVFRKDGEDVALTSSQSALVAEVESVRLIHWICEHEAQGLRLRKDNHYTINDAGTHLFPNGSVLMLTSCRAGSGDTFDSNIAASICAASNCTVIAPSSLVATHVGIEFTRKLNLIVSGAPSLPMRVADLWQTIQGDPRQREGSRTQVSAEKCFALWYGIYGNADHFVRS